MNRLTLSPKFFALLFPLVASAAFVAKAQSDAPPLTNSPAPAATQAPASASADTSSAPAERPETYTVVAGDSLWSIAHKFDTSIKKLKLLNKLKSNLLKPGQVLKISPATDDTGPAKPATPAPAKSASLDKAKTIGETQPEMADTFANQMKTPVQSSTVADAAASGSQTVATAAPHHHKKKPAQSEEETEVTGAPRAQPVQDFDVPASTFASCPVPVPVDPEEPEASPVPVAKVAAPVDTEPVTEEKTPAPCATLVSPSEMAAASAAEKPALAAASAPVPAPEPVPALSTPPLSESSKHSGLPMAVGSTFGEAQNPQSSLSITDWGERFKLEAEKLADAGIDYDDEWRPPGEAHTWAMDCSNTARYLYRVTAGIELPRTASDQYYYLHLQNKAWDAPQAANGFADCDYLRRNLKPGDLLFWENTYRPERQPPITHVMIFLGSNEKGQWIMAGSQTSYGGLHNRRHGGPDIYVFDPTRPCGGYSTWLGLVHHQGRFCAYGRPLEADPAKLAVAANN